MVLSCMQLEIFNKKEYSIDIKSFLRPDLVLLHHHDRDLNKLGITNDWNRKPRIGPWFSEGEENERSWQASC